jgi:hypothetical protein
MITRRAVSLALALALVLAFIPPAGPPPAAACSCFLPSTTEDARDLVDRADAVIVGRADRLSEGGASVVVERIYSGDVPGRILVVPPQSMCDYAIDHAETRHLLVLSKLGPAPDPYTASICSLPIASGRESIDLGDAEERYLALLDQVAPPEVLARERPLRNPDSDRTTGLVVAATVVVAAGVIIILDQARRRRA